MGDFNAEPKDAIFRDIGKRMISLMPQKRKELRRAQGTYYFHRLWGFLDHILVSQRLQPYIEKCVTTGRFPFLLTEKDAPWRTYQGPIYKGGYSDHLPIWVNLLPKKE